MKMFFVHSTVFRNVS